MAFKEIKRIIDNIQDEINSRNEFNIKEMLRSPSALMRSRALKAALTSELHIDDLKAYLEDPAPAVRKVAVEAIAKSTGDETLLMDVLDDPNDQVRAESVKYIAEFNITDETFREKVLKDPSKKVRKVLLEAFINSGMEVEDLDIFNDDPSSDVQLMLKAYKGADDFDEERLSTMSKKLIKIALRRLCGKLTEKDLSEIKNRIKEYRVPVIKEALVEMIGIFPEELSKDVLKEYMKSGERILTMASVKTYRKAFGVDENLLSIGVSLIENEDEEMRFSGAQVLKALGDPGTVDTLRAALNDPSEKVRATVIDALAAMLDYELEDELENALKSTSSRMKKSALRAVKKLKLTSLEAEVIALLENRKEDRATRILAASISGAMKYEGATFALETLVTDGNIDGKLRLAAARAMARVAPQRLLELFGVQ